MTKRVFVPDTVYDRFIDEELVNTKSAMTDASWLDLQQPSADLLLVYEYLSGFEPALTPGANAILLEIEMDKAKFKENPVDLLPRAHWLSKLGPIHRSMMGVVGPPEVVASYAEEIELEIERLKEESLARFVETQIRKRVLLAAIVDWDKKTSAGIAFKPAAFWAWEELITLRPQFAPWVISCLYDMKRGEKEEAGGQGAIRGVGRPKKDHWSKLKPGEQRAVSEYERLRKRYPREVAAQSTRGEWSVTTLERWSRLPGRPSKN